MRAPGLATLALAALAAPAAAGSDGDSDWTAVLYLQQSFPRQRRTNDQIAEINAIFGTSFEDWGDVPNVNLGAVVLRSIAPRWRVGLTVDGSAGAIQGHETIPGPARVSFEQRYSLYVDALATAHFRPCLPCRRARPFLTAAVGLGYEKDRTTLELAGGGTTQALWVDNHGTFPAASLGAGVDIALSRDGPWFVEIAASYSWARLKHVVAMKGPLAPAPTVLADSDLTGPNYWLGIGRRL